MLSGKHRNDSIQVESPKKTDPLRDGCYALQAFHPLHEESDEFYLYGETRLIEDPEIRWAVLSDAEHFAYESEVLFEFLIDRAMHTTWENWGTLEY